MASSLLSCRFLLVLEGSAVVGVSGMYRGEVSVDPNMSVEPGEVMTVENVMSELADIGLKVFTRFSYGGWVRSIDSVHRVVCSMM